MFHTNSETTNEEFQKYLKQPKTDVVIIDKQRCAEDQLCTAIRLSFEQNPPIASIMYLANASFELNEKFNDYFDSDMDPIRKIKFHEALCDSLETKAFLKHADRDINSSIILDKKRLGGLIVETCMLFIENFRCSRNEIRLALLASTLNEDFKKEVVKCIPEVQRACSPEQLLHLKDCWKETFTGKEEFYKFTVIQQHLNTAIKLFFDPHFCIISTWSLASGAFLMLREMAEKHKLVYFSRTRYGEKKYFKFCNRVPSFTRHANRDKADSISFNKEEVIYHLFKACEFYFLILLKEIESDERSSLSSYLDPQSVKDSPIAQFLVWLVITNPNMSDLNLINDERKKNLIHANFEETRKIGSEIFREKDWDANNSLQDIIFFKDSMGLRIWLDFSNTERLLELPHNPIVFISRGGKVFS